MMINKFTIIQMIGTFKDCAIPEKYLTMSFMACFILSEKTDDNFYDKTTGRKLPRNEIFRLN
jgi:hypothetical protein